MVRTAKYVGKSKQKMMYKAVIIIVTMAMTTTFTDEE